MPIYEYECAACGEKFEVRQVLFQPVKTQCPKCQSEKTKMVFSSPARISSCDTSPKYTSNFG